MVIAVFDAADLAAVDAGRLVAPSRPLALKFKAMWKGIAVGHYTFDVGPTHAGKAMIVVHEFVMRVKIGFITAFRYEHRVEEAWQGGLLQHLRSETSDDGERLAFEARRDGDAIAITGPNDCRRAPGTLLTTTCAWHPAFVRQTAILDASDGSVVALKTEDTGAAVRRIGVHDVEVGTYGFASPHLAGTLAYLRESHLAAASIERKGHRVEFVRQG